MNIIENILKHTNIRTQAPRVSIRRRKMMQQLLLLWMMVAIVVVVVAMKKKKTKRKRSGRHWIEIWSVFMMIKKKSSNYT